MVGDVEFVIDYDDDVFGVMVVLCDVDDFEVVCGGDDLFVVLYGGDGECVDVGFVVIECV